MYSYLYSHECSYLAHFPTQYECADKYSLWYSTSTSAYAYSLRRKGCQARHVPTINSARLHAIYHALATVAWLREQALERHSALVKKSQVWT